MSDKADFTSAEVELYEREIEEVALAFLATQLLPEGYRKHKMAATFCRRFAIQLVACEKGLTTSAFTPRQLAYIEATDRLVMKEVTHFAPFAPPGGWWKT